MQKKDFNRGWMFYREGEDAQAKEVHLPHDAMIYEKRNKENTAGLGYFPGGKYCYMRRWAVPAEYRERTLILEFEGVYRHASVLVNGREAARWAYGYTQFYVNLNPYLVFGEENEIIVVADNSHQPNSRWYSGSGIYRKVNLWIGEKDFIGPEAVRITTKSLDPTVVMVEVDTNSSLPVRTDILYEGKVVANIEGKRGEVVIPDARFWSDESPERYLARAALLDGENIVDIQEVYFGIRQIAWNGEEGILINGIPTKLRGACIHHDNGVIGACAFEAAEERKIRILKKAGFNAIRSAHNPCSKEMLDACDRYGIYVMDEAFDAWYIPKNSKDYTIDFDKWYEKDLAAMVSKDYNHPSVIMYSLGNETVETAQEKGVMLVARMRELLRSMDETRPLTCGISITQNIDEYKKRGSAKERFMGGIEVSEEEKEKRKKQMQSVTPEMIAHVNRVMEKIGRECEESAATQDAEDALRDVCRYLDIPGYNYAEMKTEYDNCNNPDRVVVSSETHHIQIFEHWKLIERTPRLIGDFMWVGWDYIGEAGIGALGYAERGIGFDKPYPCLTSGSGIIDITGYLRPEVYWTQMAWHMQKEPYIAVEPVEYAEKPYTTNFWNDTEAVAGWSWPGLEGKKATVRVYTPDERAELFLNGKSLGIQQVERNMAVFEVSYEPGDLSVCTYDAEGKKAGGAHLCTAGDEVKLQVRVEKNEALSTLSCSQENTLVCNGQDLAYLQILLTDEKGVIHTYPDKEISIQVTGVGTLQGAGSGAVFTEDSFTSGRCHTFYGRALAVVRAGYEPGEIQVEVKCGDLTSKVYLQCVEGKSYGI